MVLIDMDRVEERNLQRQNFYPGDVGEVKSAALAKRLSERYDRPISYSTSPVDATKFTHNGLILGCVDNGIARAEMANGTHGMYWWVDSGNGDSFGQILIGNSKTATFKTESQTVFALPLPSIQRPEILVQAPAAPQLACIDLAEQGPTINTIMAGLMVEVVRRIILGNCPWMQLTVDLEHGVMAPVMATPENCRAIMKTKDKKIVKVDNTKGVEE